MAFYAQCPDSQKEMPPVVKLNVGGRYFETRLETLRKYPESMLGAMFSGRYKLDLTNDGRYFIDRNGDYFEHILEFLRDSSMTYKPPKDFLSAVFREADYFALVALRDKMMMTPPIYPFCGDRPEPVPNYMEIKENIMKESRDFVKATARGQTIVYLLALQEEEEPTPEYVYCSEKDHLLKIIVPIDNPTMVFSHQSNGIIKSIVDDQEIEGIEDVPPILTFKADSKDHALSVSNCLFYDLKKHAFDIKMENENCTSQGVFYDFGFKTKEYGEFGCNPCYHHSKFTFLW